MLWSIPGLRPAHRRGNGELPPPSRRGRRRATTPRTPPPASAWDSAASVFDALWKIPIVAIYAAVYELTPLRVPVLWWTLLLMLLAQDFFYYWSHRGHHVIRVLWACHVVHHSSRKFNLTTALRQPWTTWTVWPFYVPLIALGRAPGGARLLLLGEPRLPVLGAHRADRQAAAALRVRPQHALPPPGPPRLPGRLPGPQLRRDPDRLGPALRLVRRRDRAARLRPHQEHRDLQPAAGGHPRVRRHRPRRAGRRQLARTGRADLPRAGLAAGGAARAAADVTAPPADAKSGETPAGSPLSRPPG